MVRILLISTLLFLYSCGETGTDEYNQFKIIESADSISYNDFYLNIIKPHCLSCHSPSGIAPSTDFSDKEVVDSFIVPGVSAGSRFYQTVLSGYMPLNQAPLSKNKKDYIKQYIEGLNKKIVVTPPIVDPPSEELGDISIGLALYELNDNTSCLSCHGVGGVGAEYTDILNNRLSNSSLDFKLRSMWDLPSKGNNGEESWDGLTDVERSSLILYVRSLKTKPNTPPVSTDISKITFINTPLEIELNGEDSEEPVIRYQIKARPSNGELFGIGPGVIYEPEQGFIGIDSFTYVSNDGIVSSRLATVTIEVKDPRPVARSETFDIKEDESLSFTLDGDNPKDVELAYKVSQFPSHGSISGIVPNLRYTPLSNYFGNDILKFTVDNGIESLEGNIIFNIESANDSPVTNNITSTVFFNVSKNIELLASDVDGDSLSYIINSNPSNGTVSLNGSVITYIPNTNYTGIDSLSYKVNDAKMDSNISLINLNIVNLITKPFAEDIIASIDEDNNLTTNLSGINPVNNTLTYLVTTPPAHGFSLLSGKSISYTPDENFSGQDIIGYKVNNGEDSLEGFVRITVNPINDRPTSESQSISTSEDQFKDILLVASDVEGSVQIQINKDTTMGSILLNNKTIRYTPDLNQSGQDSFTYTVIDSEGLSSETSTVSITISSVNDAPISFNSSVSVIKNNSLDISLDASDVDSSVISYLIVGNPSNGDFTKNNGILTYTPYLDFIGTDSISFKVNDGELDSNISVVSIEVLNDSLVSIARGKEMYEIEGATSCIVCHGSGGSGGSAKDLTTSTLAGVSFRTKLKNMWNNNSNNTVETWETLSQDDKDSLEIYLLDLRN